MSNLANDRLLDAALDALLETARRCPRCHDAAMVPLTELPLVSRRLGRHHLWTCLECGHEETERLD